MMELPEVTVTGRQAAETLCGRRITEVFSPTYLHKFTFFNGDPALYGEMLVGKRLTGVQGRGIFVEWKFEDDLFLSVCDGINMKYGEPQTEAPRKYQLLVTFDDDSYVGFTTSMYGGIYAFRKKWDNKYRTMSMESVSPLEKEFDEALFGRLVAREKKNISVKALLATEQRIPGVGNGVLQDILFNARIAPRRKIFSLSDTEIETLFKALQGTLRGMTNGGGRDTETDFFGRKGAYRCLLSKNTYMAPCPVCGGEICKETYLGGSVYYCPACQK